MNPVIIIMLFVLTYFVVSMIIAIMRMGAKGIMIDPINYEYRIMTNFKRIKIQLKKPCFYIPFGNQWTDYRTASNIHEARLNLYRIKYFTTEEEAEEYVAKMKERAIERKKNKHFVNVRSPGAY